MNNPGETSITQLAALQEIDRQVREKTEIVHTLEAEIAALENQLNAQRELARSVQEQRDTADARRRELEAHLEDEESKMKDRRMRLNRVRNEKELQALRREIEIGKEANQQTEEEVLTLMESLDALNATATEAQRTLVELEGVAVVQVAERRGRIDRLVAEAEHDRAARTQMARDLDQNLLRKYEQLFERRGGIAVVEVRNGTCLGCHMNLPPQFFNELQRSRDVRLCPNCHRILFWRPERLESADTPR